MKISREHRRSADRLAKPKHIIARAAVASAVVLLGACSNDASKGAATTSTTAAPKSGAGSTAATTPTTAAPTSSGSSKAGATEIVLLDVVFDPTALTVKAGTAVKLTNKDDFKHTATSGMRDNPDGKFNVKLDALGGGATPALTAGSYTYYCEIHPGMKGTIEVTP